MAYTAPTKAVFVEVFPAFAAITDAQYNFWSEQAVAVTEPIEACLGARMDLATMFLTAHYLTLQGIGTGAEAEVAASGMAGFKSIKSGTITLEKADGGPSQDGGEWASTSYGKQVWPMLKSCLAGPLVTSTGRVMGCGGFNGYAGPLPPRGCC